MFLARKLHVIFFYVSFFSAAVGGSPFSFLFFVYLLLIDHIGFYFTYYIYLFYPLVHYSLPYKFQLLTLLTYNDSFFCLGSFFL